MNLGWKRLCAVVGTVTGIALLVFALEAGAVIGFLYWVEYLSAMPGLSGALILFSMMGGFVALCFVVNWIAAGFRESAG